jgi:predicted PurR-regulated permease PerM
MMPLVQKRAADLPPIVTLTSVFVFGAAFGLLGMFVATPLAAVILVLIDEVYLKRQLKSSERLLETRC